MVRRGFSFEEQQRQIQLSCKLKRKCPQQQYTHGAIWALIANAIMNNNERVYEYYKILNPIEHTRTKENVFKYKVEPYVIAADVYSSVGMVGRGGWTWYTGSASWFYVATLEYLLGIKKEGNLIIFEPNIPDEWEQYNVAYNYQNINCEITVYNKAGLNKELKIYADNKEVSGNKVLLEEKGLVKIDVVI